MSQNVNLLFLRMYWKHGELKKSRGVIICSEVYQDLFNHDLTTYELFDLLAKYFKIFGSKSHDLTNLDLDVEFKRRFR